MYATGGSGPNDVWMVGGTGSRSSSGRARHFDGTSWKDVPLPRTSTLHAICVVSPTEAYAVGLLDSVIAWDGASWQALAVPAKASGSFTSVYSPGGGVMFASSPQSRYVLHKKATPIARDAAL